MIEFATTWHANAAMRPWRGLPCVEMNGVEVIGFPEVGEKVAELQPSQRRRRKRSVGSTG